MCWNESNRPSSTSQIREIQYRTDPCCSASLSGFKNIRKVCVPWRAMEIDCRISPYVFIYVYLGTSLISQPKTVVSKTVPDGTLINCLETVIIKHFPTKNLFHFMHPSCDN